MTLRLAMPASILGLLMTGNICALAADATFSLKQYQWKNRVLVISAATESDENLQGQRRAIAMSATDFSDRDMVLVTLLDDGVSSAGDKQLSKKEVAAARDAMHIRPSSFVVKLVGKDGSVKLTNDRTTAMSEIYALIDTMPMRRREQAMR